MTIHPSHEGLRHIITRRKHDNNTLQQACKCWTGCFTNIIYEISHYPLPFSDSSDSSLLNHIPHWTRTKRSTSNNRYVELMLVADRYTTQAYGNFTEQYLLSVAYLVRRVSRHTSKFLLCF